MSVAIRQHLVSSIKAAKVTSGCKNTRKRICIHETGNSAAGSRADNHARLQANGNSRQASWHWTVDDKEAVQSFTHDYQCWAAGTSQGNNEAIHIEMCVNADGDYKKTVQNTAELVAKILKDEKLTVNDIVQHNFYSGKNCPERMRSSSAPVPWTSFIQMVKSNLQPTVAVTKDQILLNTTATKEIEANRATLKKLISGAYKEGVFSSDHSNKVNSYTDSELASYGLTYFLRKL